MRSLGDGYLLRTGKERRRRAALGLLAAALISSVFALSPPAQASVFFPDDCDAEEIVEDVEKANANPGPDTIVLEKDCRYEFDEAYFDAAIPAVTSSALPVVTGDLTIVGRGAKVLSDVDDEVKQYSSFRFLTVAVGATVVVRELTIANFDVSSPPAAGADALAGAILNHGALTLDSSTVKNNEVFVFGLAATQTLGGGIFSTAGSSLELKRTTVADNEVTGVGGEVSAVGGGIATEGGAVIAKSTVKANEVTLTGLTGTNVAGAGGIYVDASGLAMSDSSVTGNTVSAKVASSATTNLVLGGGLFLDTGTTSQVARSNVSNNKVKGQRGGAIVAGGGIFNIGELAVDDPASPIADDDDDKTTVTYNKATCEGQCLAVGGGYANAVPGGVGLGGLGLGEFWNTKFKGNEANGEDGVALGGGLFLDGGGQAAPETVLHDATVSRNIAEADGWVAGGGIFATDADAVDVGHTYFYKNKPHHCFSWDANLVCF